MTLTINSELLKYHREFEDYAIFEIADILDVDEELIKKFETKNCEINNEEMKIIKRYAKILRINYLGLFLSNLKVPNLHEKVSKISIRDNYGVYKVYAQKDNSILKFYISKEAVIRLVEECVSELAYSYK